MPSRDEEIDRLYQLSLGEFTAARNALARRLGAAGPVVKALRKPNVAAWAVNQLYWRRRKTFDRLVDAADRRRVAHAKRLSGKGGETGPADTAYDAALAAAVVDLKAIVRGSDLPVSPSTLRAVTDTLQALPGPEPPGRLTRPLAPQGLEALAGLVPRDASTSGRAGRVVRARRVAETRHDGAAADRRREAARARRAAEQRRQEVAALRAELRATRDAQRQAERALQRARRTLDQARREHDRLSDRLQFVLKQIQDQREAIAREEIRRREAAAGRASCEARLASLSS